MNSLLKNWRRKCSFATMCMSTCLILGACSSMGQGTQVGNSLGTNDGSSSSNEPQGNIPTNVKPITPQLVRAEKEMREKQATEDLSRLMAPSGSYKIESGDILSIVVWDHPELTAASITSASIVNVGESSGSSTSPGFVVDHQGMVQFPFTGKLKLAGLTEEEARDLLSSKLAYYINKPNVTLRVQTYRSKRIYVDGEVRTPGVLSINDIPMSLLEALNRAGGMLPTADQSQLILARAGTSYHINLPQLVQKGINPGNIMLANGDIVRVVSRDESKVFISGEVIAPQALTMHNGRLSLNEALGEAGGIHPVSGDARQIYVVRKSAAEPVVYQLDAQAPGALAIAEGFELHPKDVVYVAATPLANWYRTISQIFPGAISSTVRTVVPIPR